MALLIAIIAAWKAASSTGNSSAKIPKKYKTSIKLGIKLSKFAIEIQVKSAWTCSRGSQLPGRLFSPSDIWKKLSHHFLFHFPIGMGSYVPHAKYQGVFP